MVGYACQRSQLLDAPSQPLFTHKTLVRRRVRISEKTDVVTIRVPGPALPLSWGRTIAPYQPPGTALVGKMEILSCGHVPAF